MNQPEIPDETHRLSTVRDLLSLSKPMQETVAQLGSMGWNHVGECVELTRGHLIAVLQKYLHGDISEMDVEAWANYVEGRDDVEFDAGREREIENILHELANPFLTHSFDQVRAKAILADLSKPFARPVLAFSTDG